MEKSSLPNQSTLSNTYFEDQLELMDFDPELVDISSLKKEKSPFTDLFTSSLLTQRNTDTSSRTHYNENLLRLLDNLQCPLLLLPRIKNATETQQIGLLADLLFTSRATLVQLANIASTIQAGITIFNIPESSMPEMDPDYAKRYFAAHNMGWVNGIEIKLVNIKKSTNIETLEAIFDRYQITMTAATQKRKELLYRLVS